MNNFKISQIQFQAKPKWSKQELVAEVPSNTWSAWVVLESGDKAVIDIDDVQMTIL